MARGVPLRVVERHLIKAGIVRGLSNRAIAAWIGRHHSVVSREIVRNGGRAAYWSFAAERRAVEQRRRPKPRKLLTDGVLWTLVRSWLRKRWSPEQISIRLRMEYPTDQAMWVSAETIYQTLFVQAKGELRAEVRAALRSGRLRRRPWSETRSRTDRIKDMVMVSERPPEAEDRAVPGFWEGDLIVGKNHASQIATLVERMTRFVMLVRIPYDRHADRVGARLASTMKRLPDFLQGSLTWDQGLEMADHATFTIKTGMPVYFCDPHSPWQRGTNENTNGLLRQYFPKGTDLSAYTQAELDAVADELNDRPRKTLGGLKPTEVLNNLLLDSGGALTP
jgi:transposase, IS30 family